MKGIILAGGSGSRLRPMTKITSKQLLPIYDRPMIYYPLNTLLTAGIKDILIIVAPEHSGDFLNLLGSGREFGAKFTYEIQEKPKGLAEAFIIAKDFIGKDSVAMILGDNIFEDTFAKEVKRFKKGCFIFTKEVSDPERFGVAKFDAKNKVTKIEEKPQKFLSPHAITGLYIYDNRVIQVAENLKPSKRNELEIVDLHNWYLKRGELTANSIQGEWIDAGTPDSLLKASNWAAKNPPFKN